MQPWYTKPTLIPTQDTYACAARSCILTSERNVKKYIRERTPRRCQKTCKERANQNALERIHPSLKAYKHSMKPAQTIKEGERERERERTHLALPIKYLEDTHNMPLTASPHHAWPRLQYIELLAEEMPLLLHLELYHTGLAADGKQLPDRRAGGTVAVGRGVAGKR
jgi:hypothetical protein